MKNIKRFLALVLISTLTALTMNVWGADVTGTINFGSASGSTQINNTEVTGEDSQGNTWTVTTVMSQTSFTQQSTYSQVGSSSKPATSIKFAVKLSGSHTFSSGNFSAKFGGFSGTAGTITLKVGTTSVGTGSLNATDDVTVSSNSAETGDSLTVTVTGISKGVKCYYISYTYDDGGGSTYTVTLNKNGTTSNITDCSGTYTLPTTGEHVADACTGWTFHCWANAAYAESTTAPSSSAITTMTSAGTAYAVYRNGSGATTEFNIASIASAEGWSNATAYTSYSISPITITYSGGGNNGKYYSSNNSWRVYSGGSITITSSGENIASITTSPSVDFTISGTTATYDATATKEFTSFTIVTGTTTYTSTPSCGPTITISGQTWVTSTNGQTVKAILDVEGTSLTNGTTLSVTSSSARFSPTLSSTTISAGAASTQLVVEYTPNIATDGTESTTLTVSANDDATTSQTFTLNGRHLPAQFVMVTKTNNDSKWWAVPGDMPSGNTYAGIEVAVDDANTPTTVTAGPANALYSLLAVASSRYSDYGTRVRLLGKVSNGCLWSNNANNGTGIKNGVTDGTGDQYEWTLTTTDGITYAINTNVAQKITEGRDLKYYTGNGNYGMYSSGNQSFRFLPVSCGTRATVSNVAVTHNSATLTWTGDSESTYTLIVKNGGTTVSTTSSATSPTEVTGLDGSTTYTYILTPGTESDPCALTGTFTTSVAPITVTLSCDGKTYNMGEQTAPYTLPTTAPYSNSCAEAPFVGWSATAVADNSASYTAVTEASSTGTYYAVYKHTSGSGGSFDGSIGGDFLIYASVSGTNYYATADLASGKLASTTDAAEAATFTFTKISGGVFSIKIGSDYYYYSSSTNLNTQASTYSWTLSNGSYGTWRVASETSGRAWIFRAGTTNKFGGYSTGNVDGSEYFDLEIGGGGTTTYSSTSGCCNEVNAPDVTVTPRSTSATISWTKQASATNGYQVVVAIGTDTVHNVSYNKATSSCIVEGLTENTTYTYTVTAKGATCNRSVTDEFTTTAGDISVAEWAPDAVYLDLGDMVSASAVIENQDTQAEVKKKLTDDLIFAKYFEGEGSMKLVSIYNGTGSAKNLSDYTIVQKTRDDQNTFKNDTTYDLSSLGTITDGQEIIFFTRDHDIAAVQACANDFLDEKTLKNSPSDNPRWIECGGGFDLAQFKFNGNDALMLFHNADTIDLFGALEAPVYKNCRNTDRERGWKGTIRNMDYGKTSADFPDSVWNNLSDYGIDINEETIDGYTARIILFRDSSVTSGAAAVAGNKTDFATFTASEWNGRYICQNTATGKGTCNSFRDIGLFNYAEYYAQYDTINGSYSLDDKRQPDGTYKIEIEDLDQMSCTNLRITVTNNTTGKTVSDHWQVPIFVKNTGSAVLTTDDVFTEEGPDCATCDVVVLKGATLQVATGGKNTVRDLEVYNGAKLYVPSEQTYNVNQLVLRSKDDTVPRADIRGTINQTAEKFGFEKRIKGTRWYKIALPYRCKIEDVTFRNGNKAHYGKDWVLRTYNGDRRANGTEGGNWNNYEGEYMEAGIGYNLAIDGDILDPGNTYVELHFPMIPNDGFTEEASISVPVVAYGANNSRIKDGEPVTPNHLGWNMIGNPYMMDYTTGTKGANMSQFIAGKLDVVDEKYTLTENGLRYVVKLKDNSREYEQVAIGDGTKNIEPFLAYFVQIGGSSDNQELNVVFVNNKQEGRSPIVRRAREEYEEEEDRTPVWCVINLTNGLDEKDETTFLISDNFTDNYEMMDDLFKMRGDNYSDYTKPVLASRNNSGEMAFNALPDASAEAGIPLNFFAATGGSYTIAWDDKFGREEIKAIQLFDKEMNQWYNLMNEAYTFSTNRTDNTDRFMVSVNVERKKTPLITTDIDNLYNGNQPQKVLIDGHIYILRSGKVYDITGKQLLNR